MEKDRELKNRKVACPVCKKIFYRSFLPHLRENHPQEWQNWRNSFITMLESGASLQQIGRHYDISWTVVEREIKKMIEEGDRTLKYKAKPVKMWEPDNFNMESTTVWSFPQRGNWATHRGDFRGNWAPEIPRNIMLRYSEKGDLVLDQFVGSGTTVIEAKLLRRRSIGVDINPQAIEIAKQRIAFKILPDNEEDVVYEPEIYLGDARTLSMIKNNSIDLICAHPPYAGTLRFSSGIHGDLSHLRVDEFIQDMHKVVRECFRVLKPGRYCAFLVGDTRRNKRVVSIGFRTWNVFVEEGFLEKENIIKLQHNCRATGFWRERSIEYNFLLLAHEYLFVFQKP